MLFNSFEFWIFFAVVFTLQLALAGRARNTILLLSSYAFYAAWDWRFLSLIWISTAVDFLVGRALASPRAVGARRRALVTTSIVVNLGILGAFKYAGFFAESLQALTAVAGIELGRFTLDVVLPVGISFYTFQTLSYTIDVYRGRLEPTRNVLDFALYVAFFPQLVAGPIERAVNLLPQIREGPRADWDRFGSGCWLVLWGLFKKVVIADNLAPLVDAVYAPGAAPTGGEILLATYAFVVQIYCDFSGYTDIARGVARMMGFELMRNFALPYFSVNPAEFWNRWHISLSTWLRDYLTYPMSRGLMRRVPARFHESAVLSSLFVTMTLCGLWHGAAWTFVLFGAVHGAWLVLHRGARRWLPSFQKSAGWTFLKWLFTFHVLCATFVIFRAESVPQAFGLLAGLANLEPGIAADWILPFLALVLPLVAIQLAERFGRSAEIVLRWPYVARAAFYFAVLLVILVQGEDGGDPFIYFQF